MTEASDRSLPEPSRIRPRFVTGEELFRLMVSSVRDYAIFLLDPDGRIATWNEGAMRIKGYRDHEIIGRHFSVFYPESEVRAGKPEWELVVAADTGRFEDEGWRVRKDGTTFWANVVITAVRDATGELRGYAKVTRDLTARRQAELDRLERERREADAARLYASRLAELERAKTEFLNLASHELRGPLAVARGYISMVADGSLEPDRLVELAPIIEGKLAQMEGLVQKMLETARLDYDQLMMAIQEVNVSELVREQVEAMRPVLPTTHRLILDIAPGVIAQGDRERLRSVVVNLLDNALKYSPEGGDVTIKVAERAGRAFISVADQGVGIDSEDLQRIFDRFTRLEHPETMNVGGTGLGLFLSREIARRHGGDVMVESAPGAGSRFTVSIPQQPAGPPPLRVRRRPRTP